jgi:hypothetical protein
MLLDFMHERDTLELVHEDVPQQKNKLVNPFSIWLHISLFDLSVRHYINDSYLNYVCSHDCGIYVLKFLEMWDGERKWGDKTMPDFTLVTL